MYDDSNKAQNVNVTNKTEEPTKQESKYMGPKKRQLRHEMRFF